MHGTTLVTNTVLEGTGADVATVTTKGYRDLVEIGRQSRSEMYSLLTRAVLPLSPRKWRIEVDERSLSDGTVVARVRDADLAYAELVLRMLRSVTAGLTPVNGQRWSGWPGCQTYWPCLVMVMR